MQDAGYLVRCYPNWLGERERFKGLKDDLLALDLLRLTLSQSPHSRDAVVILGMMKLGDSAINMSVQELQEVKSIEVLRYQHVLKAFEIFFSAPYENRVHILDAIEEALLFDLVTKLEVAHRQGADDTKALVIAKLNILMRHAARFLPHDFIESCIHQVREYGADYSGYLGR